MPGDNLTRVEAQERKALVEVDSYDVTLDLTTGPEVFRSVTTVTFSAKGGASTFFDAITHTVHSIDLNGAAVDTAAADGQRIQIDNLTDHNVLTIVADMAYTNTGEGLHRFVDPVDDEVYLYSQFEVADSRRVFAVFEQPDLKATFAFTVTAPAHWTVVSNSPTPEPVPAHNGHPGLRWTFEPTPRISSYITAIVAGPYHRETGSLTSSDGREIPLGVYCRASLAEHLDTDEILDVTRRGFAFFEETFDFPYPFAKYDQLFVPEFNAGAMENAGAVTLRESYVFRSKVPDATVERRTVTILHELAHMWFGDLVTMRWWDDLWLNESFAEFASTLATAEATRWTQAWTTFSTLEKNWAYRQDQLPSTHPVVADMVDLAAVEVNFDGITYAKGAAVLRQLVAYVGQEEFFAGVRRYFRAHAWGNTTLRDLLVELEATSGRELTSWSALWLERAGVTLLRPEIETDDDGVITSFAITQEVPAEHPTQRPHRLAIGGYDVVEQVDGSVALERTLHVELDIDGERTEVPALVGEERPQLILVNDDDLAYAKVRLDAGSLETAVEHLGAFTDSLPRALVWNAAWDMTRDGEWSARAFVDLVLGNIAAESDSSVVLVLLRQLQLSVESYVADEHRAEVKASVADRLWELAQGAAAGSDTQLQLLKAFAVHATTEPQLDVVVGLDDGSLALDGLQVDTDLRWELLLSLAAGGRAGEAEIEARLAADATATGRQAAAAARAAIATPEAKAAAWHAMVTEEGMPNAILENSIIGFNRTHDRALLAPFVEPYFAALERVWATRGNDMAQSIVQLLYPAALVARPGADVLTRTDEFLDSLDEGQSSLRRMIVEVRDGAQRALRVQEADRRA